MPAIQLMTVSSTETKPSAESAGVKSQKLSGLQGTFSNYMRQNSPNTAAQTAKGDSGMLQTKQPGNDTSVKQQYEQYQSRSQTAADKVTDYADGERVDTGAVQETVEEAVENIKESIKENLGVDEEQLEAAMELLGLTQADLLDPQQLIALAVELTGSEDAAGMLFQENFQLVMQEAGAITDDLLQQIIGNSACSRQSSRSRKVPYRTWYSRPGRSQWRKLYRRCSRPGRSRKRHRPARKPLSVRRNSRRRQSRYSRLHRSRKRHRPVSRRLPSRSRKVQWQKVKNPATSRALNFRQMYMRSIRQPMFRHRQLRHQRRFRR